MKKLQLCKKSFYLLLTVVTFLPAVNLSARGGDERRGPGGRSMDSQRKPPEHKYQSPGDKAVEAHRVDQNRYNENAAVYGSGEVSAPTYPPDSQPGMNGDSDALYKSYMQSNTPQ